MTALAIVLATDNAPSGTVHAALTSDLAEQPQWECCAACGNAGHDVRERLGHMLDEEGPSCCTTCDTAALAAAFDAVDPPRARDLVAAAYEHAVKVMRRDADARVAAECRGAA